uniref:Sutoxin alpha-subunit n=1 Tax=Siganus unimaculatus TaxID=215396 RepID=A0A348G6S5_SIGUN|nr:sutoxin alpha-subunit [Siganus unimaculatus]
MSSDITMAALGRPFSLGMLYDARREKLIPGFSLFGDETLQQYESCNPQRSSEFKVTGSDSIDSKSNSMEIEASLGASFLGGLVDLSGSAKYLYDTKKYQNQSRVTLTYKATTVYKQFTAPPGTVTVQHTEIAEKGLATHVVTGILYGANAFFVFDSEKLEDSNTQEIQGRMEAVIEKIITIEGSASIQLTDEEKDLTSTLSCKFHGDFLLESLPTTFEEAVATCQKLPELLGEDGADAIPIKVWLVPLKKFHSKAEILVREIAVGRVRKIQNTLEDLDQVRRRCHQAMDDKDVKHFPLIHDRLKDFNQIFQDYCDILKQKIAEKLPLIRAGSEDQVSLEQILAARDKSPFSNEKLGLWLDTMEREICAIKACVGMMDETQTKFISNQTELDREVLAPGVIHAVCFVFTSLGRTDYFLKALTDYMESRNLGRIDENPPCPDGLWCFSPGVVINMKRKAQTFSELAESLKDSRNVRFFTAALDNEKYQGASIYYYMDGTIFTQDFTFPQMPYVEARRNRRTLRWFACNLTFDPNTAHAALTLSDDNKKVVSGRRQKSTNHPERFDHYQQVLCKESLHARHYWEVEWSGYVRVGVAYLSINRKGSAISCSAGQDWHSWAFDHEPRNGYSAIYGKVNKVTVRDPGFKRLGVFLDRIAGTLSYYMVTSDELHHLHTFRTRFIEPVYPIFRIGSDNDHGIVTLL